MGWLLVITVIVLLLGPLRHWLGRHWAFLTSVAVGAALGLVLGGVLMARTGGTIPYLPLVFAAIGAAALGQEGPTWLRKITKDGKD